MAYGGVRGSACKEFEERLVLHYFDDCPPQEAGQVERHLGQCAACRRFLEDLRGILPKTRRLKEMPRGYWDDYYAEMIDKLDGADRRSSWRLKWLDSLRPWTVPAVATAAAVILTLTLAFTRGLRWMSEGPPKDRVPGEILSDPGRLEFFSAMDLLESLTFLESLERAAPDRERVHEL
jgi:hypothetical protein